MYNHIGYNSMMARLLFGLGLSGSICWVPIRAFHISGGFSSSSKSVTVRGSANSHSSRLVDQTVSHTDESEHQDDTHPQDLEVKTTTEMVDSGDSRPVDETETVGFNDVQEENSTTESSVSREKEFVTELTQVFRNLSTISIDASFLLIHVILLASYGDLAESVASHLVSVNISESDVSDKITTVLISIEEAVLSEGHIDSAEWKANRTLVYSDSLHSPTEMYGSHSNGRILIQDAGDGDSSRSRSRSSSSMSRSGRSRSGSSPASGSGTKERRVTEIRESRYSHSAAVSNSAQAQTTTINKKKSVNVNMNVKGLFSGIKELLKSRGSKEPKTVIHQQQHTHAASSCSVCQQTPSYAYYR